MSRLFLCLIAAYLTLAAYPGRWVSASPADRSGDVVQVLVNGAPQRLYAHRGRGYIEALKGREYIIRLRNPYAVRVAVALSVDGLNTIDARQTTAADARKWVLGPYESVTISGWQTSRTEARRFEFTTEADSYAQALGRGANLGVITAAVFRERVAAVARDAAGSSRRAESPPPAAAQESSAKAAGNTRADDEYAATGMGRRIDHAVTQVWLDLEATPAQTVNIRYEFRPQLVRLGILPGSSADDTLERRERARGFEPGFSPEPLRRR
ncbi:MAG: hypothetical protein ACRD3G_22140 [Vicinamibacterales bacterium]